MSSVRVDSADLCVCVPVVYVNKQTSMATLRTAAEKNDAAARVMPTTIRHRGLPHTQYFSTSDQTKSKMAYGRHLEKKNKTKMADQWRIQGVLWVRTNPPFPPPTHT